MVRETQVVGLDVGTSEVRSVAVAFDGARSNRGEHEGGSVRVLGKASVPARGVRKGQIIHIEEAVASISKVMGELERQAGIEPRNLIVGITGSHIECLSSHGVVPVKGTEVRSQDIQQVVEAAQAVPISAEREVLHVIPQEFIVDGQGGIKDPLGISGVRLEARVQILTAASFGAQNLMKCVNRCGYSVSEIVFSPIASALKVLDEDEREQGICLIDIGAGTVEVSIFYQGVLAFGTVLGLGGQHVTNDLAAGLRTTIKDAERLKLQLDISPAAQSCLISVPEIGREGQRGVPSAELRAIAGARVEEILLLAKQAIASVPSHASMLSGGVVLTGGGARMLGIAELAEKTLGLPCRARHAAFGEDSALVPAEFLTAYGLAAFERHSRMIFGSRPHLNSDRWYKRAAKWLVEHF